MMSLERLNNKKGYTKENTVLICVEFNSIDRSSISINQGTGSSQWSKEKFQYLLNNSNCEKITNKITCFHAHTTNKICY